MKKLKYEGKEGIINQFGTCEPGWFGEKHEKEVDLLLKVPGFREIDDKEFQELKAEKEAKEKKEEKSKKGGK